MDRRKVRQPQRKGPVRVPVVMQLESLECGAACLAMVLAYYEKWIPLEEVRRDCGVSRDGSRAGNIVRAAQMYGLQASGYRYSVKDLQESATFPCIIYWEARHFVVLDGFRGRHVLLNDPARGTVRITLDQFCRSYSGICLLFQPAPEFEPSGRPKSMLSYAGGVLASQGQLVIFALLSAVISMLLGLISPVFSRIFTDRLLTGQDPEWISSFFLILSLFTALQVVTAWIQTICSLRLNGKMDMVGSTSYMWKVLHLPMEFFSQRMSGDIQGRQRLNTQISSAVVNTFVPLLLETGMMVFYLAVMLRYSVLLSAVGIGTVLLSALVSRIVSSRRVNLSRGGAVESANLTSSALSGLSMIETIKASGSENGFFARWSGYQAAVNTNNIGMDELNSGLGMIPAVLSSVSNIVITVTGVGLVMRGQFTIGMVQAFLGFLSSFFSPAGQIISAGQTIQEMRTNMERVGDVMEYPDDVLCREDNLSQKSIGENSVPQPPAGQKSMAGRDSADDAADAGRPVYRKLTGRIDLEDVSFGYAKLDPPLIEHFSMHAEPGSRIAFVGMSGCGKSTLAKLITGLVQPWSGSIRFDGKGIGEIDRAVFTGSVGVVDQDIRLYEDTIENNIRMFDMTMDVSEVIRAAKDAAIHDDILRRERGYRCRIRENGRDFSGGQRQRLEIARVLAQNPSILILDEATSALDAETEKRVMDAIQTRGVTCLVIAHRLSTIRDCDEIIVLDHGKVRESGTHEELYRAGGLYRELVDND